MVVCIVVGALVVVWIVVALVVCITNAVAAARVVVFNVKDGIFVVVVIKLITVVVDRGAVLDSISDVGCTIVVRDTMLSDVEEVKISPVASLTCFNFMQVALASFLYE